MDEDQFEQTKRMFDVSRYENYRFYRAGRWYYIKDGKFVRPGTGKPDVTIDFVCALTEEDYKEFESDPDNKIAPLSDDFLDNPCRTASIFILNHGREPEEGLYLIVGYKSKSPYTNRYVRRKIEKIEKPS